MFYLEQTKPNLRGFNKIKIKFEVGSWLEKNN